MMDKRLGKTAQIHRMRPGFLVQGPPDADIVLVGVGSTAAVNLEALPFLEEAGIRASTGWFRTLAPFPAEQFAQAVARAQHILVVEQNATGQVAQLIKAEGLYDRRYGSLLKYDGVPFLPEDVAEYVQQLLSKVEVAP
jgi:2-oxoglutarate ferredoxin oxidoreductase subunit alpha